MKLDLGVSQDGVPTGERVGEWGGLAVGEAHQGRGIAHALVSAAEAELRAAGCTLAQLELLAPAHWKHGRRFEHALGDGHYACPTTPAVQRRHLTQPACERPRYEGSPTITPLLTTRHDHKERLHAWYVARLGYGLQVPGDYMASTTGLPTRRKFRMLVAYLCFMRKEERHIRLPSAWCVWLRVCLPRFTQLFFA